MKKAILTIIVTTVILSCSKKTETTTTTTVVDSVGTATKPVETSLRFIGTLKKDSTIVNLTFNGNDVSGDMHWNPYEKDGAIGTLKGNKNGDTLFLDYDYMIEGSQQLEQKMFILQGDKLLEMGGELEDKNGKLLMKNSKNAEVRSTLKRAD